MDWMTIKYDRGEIVVFNDRLTVIAVHDTRKVDIWLGNRWTEGEIPEVSLSPIRIDIWV